VLLTN
jgi:hypothetical protein